jgi:hypothetical protein
LFSGNWGAKFPKKAEYAALIVREKASSSRGKAFQMHAVLQILENS